MLKNTLSYNIVVLKEGINLPFFPIDKVKEVLLEKFPDKTPIINQFPDLILFTISDEQINIAIQSNSVVITNSSAEEVTSEKVTILGSIVKKICDLEDSSISAYGINIALDVTLENRNSQVLNEAFNNTWLISTGLLNSDSLLSSSFKIREQYDTDSLVEITMEPRPTRTGDPTNKIVAQINRHWTTDSLPAISHIKNSFIGIRDAFYIKLENIDQE